MAPRHVLLTAAVLASLFLSYAARAQDCGCDHTISSTTLSVHGTDLGVQPGDVVCVEAGTRPFLSLESFVGTETAPVVIKNCGGQVVIDNSDKGYGLRIVGSSFFHVTGTGDPQITYGFDIAARRTGPDYAAMGVAVGDLSTDYELDHLEVHDTGFAGFNLKTEPRCDGSANLGAFVQRNTRVHNTYVHHTGGEAFYVGSTGYGGRDYPCNGQTVKLHPHEHHGVWLHDNVIEETGWDGLQVGVTPKDCEVYRNVIRGVGRTATDLVQTRGIQIGGASACKIYDNYLEDGPTIGVFVLGAGTTEVTNNVIVGFAEDGIYANDRQDDAVQGMSYAFLHNTVVGCGDSGLTLFGERTQANVVFNNLFVATGATDLNVGGSVDWSEGGNLTINDVAGAGFVDASAADYHLVASSAARDTGVTIPGYAVPKDRDGVVRDALPDVGAYEYTDAPPPDGGTGGAGGTGGTGGASGAGGTGGTGGASGAGEVGGVGGVGGADGGSDGGLSGSGGSTAAAPGSSTEDGGCGCFLARRSGDTGGIALLAAIAAACLRRRRRGPDAPL
jgi:hypothetical protein